MPKLKFKFVYVLVLYMMAISSLNVFAKEVPYTLEDRDRLMRIETSLDEFKVSVDKRLEEFKDSVDKRFEQIDKRFEQVINLMWMLVAIFVGVTGATISFAIWDRRSMIRPFETKVREIEGKLDLEEKSLKASSFRLKNLLKRMKMYLLF